MKRWGSELTLQRVNSNDDGELLEREQVEETAAKCLLLFSHAFTATTATSPLREFECKTCNRRFPSFQALGGHRASHKRLRFSDEDGEDEAAQKGKGSGKAKGHECSVCGLEFSIGQALGGHMRRHRNAHELGHHAPEASRKPDGKKDLPELDLNFPPVEDHSPCVFG